ncbi:hypothetical protein Hdeb2414_s0012g00394681 [Helianthus debilis subsp. tardiflorus]
MLQTFFDVEATVPYIWSLLLCCNPGTSSSGVSNDIFLHLVYVIYCILHFPTLISQIAFTVSHFWFIRHSYVLIWVNLIKIEGVESKFYF